MSVISNHKSLRLMVQIFVSAVTIIIGWQFYNFVSALMISQELPQRPAGVEAFLPISALMSLRYWFETGVFNRIHPASMILLILFLAIGLVLKKGFCSWVCPIGFLSERLFIFHQDTYQNLIKKFGLKPKHESRKSRLYLFMPLDLFLRSLKYIILIYFVWYIFLVMNVLDLHTFIYSPYNRVADIKMLLFFVELSSFAAKVLLALFLLSLIIPFFWCRYLCPYGALLGLISLASPWKIRRNVDNCTQCRKCTSVCPASIRVHNKRTVFSDECFACFRCVDACPGKFGPTLAFSYKQKAGHFFYSMAKPSYALLLMAILFGGIALAKGLDLWQNRLSETEYRYHGRNLQSAEYNHHQGQVTPYSEEQLRQRGFYYD